MKGKGGAFGNTGFVFSITSVELLG